MTVACTETTVKKFDVQNHVAWASRRCRPRLHRTFFSDFVRATVRYRLKVADTRCSTLAGLFGAMEWGFAEDTGGIFVAIKAQCYDCEKRCLMNKADLEGLFDLSRRRTLELLDAVGASPAPATILGWRPGPGRAHLAWQLMHIAATEDKHLHVRMTGGAAQEPDFVRRFASGSVPDDDIPSMEVIRRYLVGQRDALLIHLRDLSEADLTLKPNASAPYVYSEWFQVLALHEAYHNGQAHLTYNLYRTTQDNSLGPVGH